MWRYKDVGPNELYHWKYIRREKTAKGYRYFYPEETSATVKKTPISEDPALHTGADAVNAANEVSNALAQKIMKNKKISKFMDMSVGDFLNLAKQKMANDKTKTKASYEELMRSKVPAVSTAKANTVSSKKGNSNQMTYGDLYKAAEKKVAIDEKRKKEATSTLDKAVKSKKDKDDLNRLRKAGYTDEEILYFATH